MAGLVLLAFGLLAFVGLHLGLSARPVRAPMIASLGQGGFLGLYSLVAFMTLGVTIWGYSEASYVALWASPGWTRWVAIVGMAFAFLLLVVGYTTPNPTGVMQAGRLERDEAVVGIAKITRHPANWGFAVWGLAHLPANGALAEVMLFGSMALLGLVGSVHIDARRAAETPESWARFAAQTSLVPFVALAQGRTRLRLGELGWWRVALALALYVAMLLGHPHLIGVRALPVF